MIHVGHEALGAAETLLELCVLLLQLCDAFGKALSLGARLRLDLSRVLALLAQAIDSGARLRQLLVQARHLALRALQSRLQRLQWSGK